MYTLVISLHVVLALVLITLVLLQQGKGADMGAVMGGGGSNSLFGVSGASNLLVKLTTSVAVMFMLTSVMLVRLSATGSAAAGGPKIDPLSGSSLEGMQEAVPAGSSQNQNSAVDSTASNPSTTTSNPVVAKEENAAKESSEAGAPPAVVPAAPANAAGSDPQKK